MKQVFILRAGGEPETLTVEGRAGRWNVSRSAALEQAEAEAEAEVVRLPDGRISLVLSDGRQFCGRVFARPHGEIEVSSARGICRFGLADPLHDRVDHARGAALEEGAQEDVRALMPGRVIEIAVKPGDKVAAGTLLLVLEAMKMQNEIRAERSGVIVEVVVSAGEAVDGGARMLTIQSVTD